MYRTYSVPVRFVESADSLVLRELNGEDEESVGGIATREAIQLIQRLIVDNGDGYNPGHLIATDRDMLLAEIYTHTFGSRIQGSMDCPECGELYDFDFNLEEITNQLPGNSPEHPIRFNGDDVLYQIKDQEIKLLNGDDEMMLERASIAEANKIILDRSCPGHPPEIEMDLELFFSEIAPILSMDMESVCPECGLKHAIEYDMQYYLLTKLRQEQQFLRYEIHRIASAYQWTRQEILALPRRVRKQHVSYIESDLERGLI